ncbi:hypothetical protein [Paenibacillus turpanensis]|nr:hypothetical protein [Paenibacillus turpanensis]
MKWLVSAFMLGVALTFIIANLTGSLGLAAYVFAALFFVGALMAFSRSR